LPALADNVLEEITVTSQRREQNIQDVGVAVTAFSGEQIKTLGFEQSIDVARMTPGVFISASIAGQTSQYTIRGVTQNDFTDSVESPVAVYVDDGYIAMMQGQTFALFDIDRVEVIKGPQSTLFGRNATGGVVQYITRKPTEDLEGYGDVTYGRFNQVRLEAAVSGPLTENVLARFSVMYNRFDPFLKNLFPQGAVNIGGPVPGGGQDLYDDNTFAGRGQLLFKLNEDADFLISVFHADTKTSSAPYQDVATVAVLDAQGRVINTQYSSPTEVREGIGPGGIALDMNFDGNPLRPTPGGDFFGYVDADGPGRTFSQDFAFQGLDRFKTTGGTAKLTWDFDAFTLISITDYKHFSKYVAMDVDAGPADQFIFASDAGEDSLTQEIRLEGETERMRWVTGLYYLYIDNNTNNGFLVLPTSVMSPFFLGAGVGADLVNQIALKTNSYSAFGQVEYDVTETVTLTVGGRVVREDKSYNFAQSLFASTNDLTVDTTALIVPLRTPFADKTGNTLWAGKAQIDWRPNEDVLLYVSVNRGVKAGSFNAKLPDGTPPLSDARIPYKAEVLTSYEVGFKSTLLGGAARLNGAFYYYDYNDYQASVFSTVSSVTQNANATIKGGELELIATPADGLDMMFSIGALDATVKNLEIAPGVFRNVEPAFTPDVQVSGLIRYEFPQELAGGNIALQGDASYTGSFFDNIRNFDSQRHASYVVVNARINWRSLDGAWDMAVFVNNLLKEHYTTVGFDLAGLCGCNEELYGKPRWWGISVRREF
jgi:iron complex outermembrane receptor protein